MAGTSSRPWTGSSILFLNQFTKFYLILSLVFFYSIESWSMQFGDTFFPKTSVFRIKEAYEEIETDQDLRSILAEKNKNSISPVQQIKGPSKIETIKFQHYYKGLEVLGSMVIHHQNETENTIRDRIARFDLDIQPTVSIEEATSLAHVYAGELGIRKLPQLRILPSSSPGSAQLIYWVELNGKDWHGGRDLIIHAHTGQLIANLSHDFTLVPVQVYSAKQQGLKTIPNFATDPNTGRVRLKDCQLVQLKDGTSRTITALSCILIYRGISPETEGQCQIIDGLEGFPLDINASHCLPVVKDGEILDPSDTSTLKAADNSKKVLAYYENRFGRKSYDNKGSDLVSVIHAGDHLANAFWMTDLNTMVYGDGNGKNMGDLTQSLDVAGHEMTHGIIAHTADLIMMNESGALNEAFSDFFGKLIEGEDNWVVGRTLFLGPDAPRGIRDLANPGNLSDTLIDSNGNPIEKPYPAHQSEAALLKTGDPCDGSNDQCWVHFNSTIPSHAAYLVYQAIGKEKTELLYYTTLTQNMTATDNFKSSTQALLQTCSQLHYSEADCESVKNAYIQVGLL
jgi:Zn-dependent metalloprotease